MSANSRKAKARLARSTSGTSESSAGAAIVPSARHSRPVPFLARRYTFPSIIRVAAYSNNLTFERYRSRMFMAPLKH